MYSKLNTLWIGVNFFHEKAAYSGHNGHTCRLRQQQLQILPPQLRDDAVVRGDDCVGEIALGLLELQDFFLDRIARDQAIGEDATRLTDAVGAVDRLRFDGGVPPGVEEEDVVGRR